MLTKALGLQPLGPHLKHSENNTVYPQETVPHQQERCVCAAPVTVPGCKGERSSRAGHLHSRSAGVPAHNSQASIPLPRQVELPSNPRKYLEVIVYQFHLLALLVHNETSKIRWAQKTVCPRYISKILLKEMHSLFRTQGTAAHGSFIKCS